MLAHLKKLDWVLLAGVILVFLMGLISFYGDPLSRSFFYRQAIFGGAGFILILLLSLLDWRILKNTSVILMGLYGAGIALLITLFVVGSKIRGVVSWFKLGLFNFEPVEIIKIILVLVLAKYFSSRHIELYRWKNIIISAIYAFLPAGLVLLQPDFGSALILLTTWLVLVLISGIKAKQFFWIILIVLIAATLLWSYGFKDYQKNRIVSYLYPNRDPLGGSYQSQQAMIAIGSGGLWGKSLGQGSQTQLGFLPENKTDFVFAAIAEEWGLIGIVILLAGWFIIFRQLRKNILMAPDNFSRLFITGIMIILGTHFIINIGANVGLLPITGIPLPFVSYGGSSLISFCIALGLIQSIHARSQHHNFEPDQVLS